MKHCIPVVILAIVILVGAILSLRPSQGVKCGCLPKNPCLSCQQRSRCHQKDRQRRCHKRGLRQGCHFNEAFTNPTHDYAPEPTLDIPASQLTARSYWGPYLWGWHDRAYYEYGPDTRAPYPYQFECDDYARQQCKKSCIEDDKFCYKKHYMKCSAGNALVDPERTVPKCP
jgi:hypothetical protein